MRKPMRVLLFLGLAWVISAGFAAAQESPELIRKREDDSQLVEGLRRRRLFDLAEYYCRDQLNSTSLDPTTQVMLVVELMKTQTAKAILAPADQRVADWNSVNQTATKFVESNPDHPRRFLVEVQLALSHLAHGRLLRQEISAEMATEQARDQALMEIRSARDGLSALQREIAKAIPDQRARALGTHDLSVQQLLNLNNNIGYQLAICNLNRAQLYDVTDRLNRIDALNSVTQRLIEVQGQTSVGQPLWWKTKLGQLECLRLLGKTGEARRLIDALPADEIPVATQQAILEQKVRLAIDLGDESFSGKLLDEVKQLNARSAELDLALIELSVDLAARAATDQKKQEWLNSGSQAARAIETTHGAYWGRRADLVLIEAAGGIPSTQPPNKDPIKMVDPSASGENSVANTQLDQLIRLAEDAARKERWGDAIKAYDFAATKARSLGGADQALRLDIRVSQILEKKGDHELAASRLIDASKRDFKLPIAAAAHLRGCWNYAQTATTDQPDRQAALRDLFNDHLEIWPNQPSANQARVWLAGQLQSDRNWETALELYLQVANDSPLLPSAIEQAGVCATAFLQELQRSGKPTRSTAVKLMSLLAQKQATLPASDMVSMQMTLGRAELDLIYGSAQPNPGLASELAKIESAGEAELKNQALAIHAVSICVDKPQQAQQQIGQLGSDLDSLDLCERCLSAVFKESKLNSGVENVLELRLAVIQQALQIPEMMQAENSGCRTPWLSRKSETLTALGRDAEAIGVLTELEKQFPNNAAVQIQLARALTALHGIDAPEKPLGKWRRIAARLKTGTPNWYEAKYQVAFLLYQSGEQAEAEKLLKFIKVIPGWEKSELRPKFEQLLEASATRK